MTRDRPPLPDAKLVRVAASDASWIEELPAVPGGATVTVTVGEPALATVPADDLVSRGYRVAGTVEIGGRPAGAGFVDLLVPDALARAHPGGWRALLQRSERAFAVAHGPVRTLFADELDLHARALDRSGPGG